jgi:site-specific recombinase XerD
MIDTRSASTALNKHKGLQQFFRWLLDEDEITRSPMDRVKQPKTPQKLIPVIRDDDTRRVLDACRGKGFASLRNEAIVRLYCNTGARLSEIGNLLVADVDLNTESVHIHGKGAKDRRVRIGPKTSRAVSKYLRARAKRQGADEVPELWLAERGLNPLRPNGIKILLKRLGTAAGIDGLHAHRWRHNYAHEWKLAGGDTGDLMLLLGWASDDMPRHYGASAAAERAQEVQVRLGIGERV